MQPPRKKIPLDRVIDLALSVLLSIVMLVLGVSVWIDFLTVNKISNVMIVHNVLDSSICNQIILVRSPTTSY
jgi:hypothetical protein